MSLMVTNIQRMCMHDGPGIRTTVFLKGCSLHCPWCANPENISGTRQYYFDNDKCRKCDTDCRYNPQCIMLRDASQDILHSSVIVEPICPLNALGVYGNEKSVSEVYKEAIKDKKYWSKGGGITFSGGEPLLQIEELSELMKLFREEGIHITIETALFVSQQSVTRAMDYTDLFIVDVKLLDRAMCREVLGGNIDIYSKNIAMIASEKKNILFRVPCSDAYTLTDINQTLLLDFFSKYIEYPIEIFQIHSLADKKYKTLNQSFMADTSGEKTEELYQKLKANKNTVNLIKL